MDKQHYGVYNTSMSKQAFQVITDYNNELRTIGTMAINEESMNEAIDTITKHIRESKLYHYGSLLFLALGTALELGTIFTEGVKADASLAIPGTLALAAAVMLQVNAGESKAKSYQPQQIGETGSFIMRKDN